MTGSDDETPHQVLRRDAVRLDVRAGSQDEAIRECGRVLVELGAVAAPYTAAMLERERSVSTFLGAGVAIPHGTDEARRHVRHTAVAVLRFDQPIDWDGQQVSVCVPIAATGNDHVGVLQSLAAVIGDEDKAKRLADTDDVEEIVELLSPQPGE